MFRMRLCKAHTYEIRVVAHNDDVFLKVQQVLQEGAKKVIQAEVRELV